jgi:hypothetical protein
MLLRKNRPEWSPSHILQNKITSTKIGAIVFVIYITLPKDKIAPCAKIRPGRQATVGRKNSVGGML